MKFRNLGRRVTAAILALSIAAAGLFGGTAAAQVRSVDPDQAIDGDLMPGAAANRPPVTVSPPDPARDWPAPSSSSSSSSVPAETQLPPAPGGSTAGTGSSPGVTSETGALVIPAGGPTYRKDDLIGAAEGVFGKGAQGLAGLIEDLLRKQGEPNGYITGREGSAAFVVGLRYGSGTLYHKVEGEMPVYWTGPSVGFDAGANAANTFVLVYNLYDTADLYRRFPAGEGQAYLIGGFHVSYLRRGNIVLIPVRAGAGLRLGINAGYMKFSRSQKWMPF